MVLADHCYLDTRKTVSTLQKYTNWFILPIMQWILDPSGSDIEIYSIKFLKLFRLYAC